MLWNQAYLFRLKRDLDRWVEQGLVTPANADKIAAQLQTRGETRRLPALLTMLGAALLICAALTFIAANWNEIGKGVKLALIFGAMWSAYGCAIWLERREQSGFAQAAVLAGLGLFGAAIMLIAQIYHIQTDDPFGLLVWCLAALATAWALPSRAALALTFGLAIIWSAFATQGDAIHWFFFVPWLAAAILAFRLRWPHGFHLALLSFIVWIFINGDGLTHLLGGTLELASLVAVIGVALWMAPLAFSDRWQRLSFTVEHYGILIAFISLSILQLDDGNPNPTLIWFVLAALIGVGAVVLASKALRDKTIHRRELATPAGLGIAALLYPAFASLAPHGLLLVYAAILLLLTVGLIGYGLARHNRFAVNLGFWAFGLEVLYLYFQTLGTLLGTAAFFFLGGIILIAGGVLIERLRRRLVETATKGVEP